MLPDFDENGFLPEGVWDCSVNELQKRFAVFRRSDQRLKLFAKLEQFLEEVLKTEWIEEIIIDGSFVTDKDEPNDIDIILGLYANFKDAEIPFWTAKILAGNFLGKRYDFDVFVEIFDSPKHKKRLDFFQQIKESEFRKGVVRLIL